MISIAIADDHQLFRQGIISLLNTIDDFKITNQAEDGKELLEQLKFEQPNVILLDINMPKIDGIKAAKIIKKEYPSVKIIMLSMHADHETIQKAISIGIDGYLPKDTGKEELEIAINTVCNGERYFNEAITSTIMNGLISPNITQTVRLTPRENEVLKLICEECTTQEIAEKLFISFNTVETHRKNLLHKTGSKNSLGLLKFALENKLFSTNR